MAELRLLLDAARIALLVAYPVDLGLRWWTQTDATIGRVSTVTGYGSLRAGSGNEGYAWWSVIGVVALIAAAALRRRWALRIGAVLGALAAMTTAISVASGSHFGYTRDGTWVGFTIVLAAAGLTLADASSTTAV